MFQRQIFEVSTDTGSWGDTGPCVHGELRQIRWNPTTPDTGADLQIAVLPRQGDTGDGFLIVDDNDCLGANFIKAPRQPTHDLSGAADQTDTGTPATLVPYIAAGDRPPRQGDPWWRGGCGAVVRVVRGLAQQPERHSMTAVIAVSKPEAVEILSDAAGCSSTDGVVVEFASKQFPTSAGFLLVSCGWRPALLRFYDLSSRRCVDFDAVVADCDELWRHVIDGLPDPGCDYGMFLAGWSARRKQLELYETNSQEKRRSGDLVCVASGGSDECAPLTNAFVARFAPQPAAFVAQRDGLALMEALRRVPRQFEQARHPCVGGFVQHTVLTRAGVISSRVIHRWPDSVGRPISLEAA